MKSPYRAQGGHKAPYMPKKDILSMNTNDQIKERIHATAVAKDGRAALLIGESGRGKSDLALRLIDRGFQLVADDQVWLEPRPNGTIIARTEPRLAGTIEIRGLGLMKVPHITQAPVYLVVNLDLTPERLPKPAYYDALGTSVPQIAVNAFEASTPIKIEWALSDPAIIGNDLI